jgi:NAD(P)-dependent dehydrogenase (short-subunit alcohol dehydrogenase family)
MNSALSKLFDLSGRHALVTGAGSGIGRSAALLLAAHGATVTLCGRRVDRLQQVRSEIERAGGRAAGVPMDVGAAASIVSAIESAASSLGPVEILVNNAGVPGHSSIADMSEAEWDGILDTNLKGAWLCAREVARRLIAVNKPGSIINVASVLGFVPQKGTGPYGASKAGLLHLTRVMANEWARHGIRVNAIAPGYIATDMADEFMASERGRKVTAAIAQRRVGAVDELSGALLLLASDASSYMTGSTITVDGGLSLGTI